MTEPALSKAKWIAKAAMSWPFDPEDYRTEISRADVADAIEGMRSALRPAKTIPLDETRDEQRKLANLIGKIGLRIRPDFTQDQAQLWSAEVVDALSNLPIRAAIAAAREANHEPIRFPGEVHPIIAKLAEPHVRAYRSALRNLERLQHAIDNPPKQIEGPLRRVPQISDEELQELSPPLRAMGIGAGWLIEEEDGTIRWSTQEEQDAHAARQAKKRQIARAGRSMGDDE